MSDEQWVWLQAFPGYQVSSWGRVKGRRGRLLSITPKRGRYPGVLMSLGGGGKLAYQYVGRLVCEAFHGPPPSDDAVVIFLDGDTTNCHVDNVRWGSPDEMWAYKRALKEE